MATLNSVPEWFDLSAYEGIMQLRLCKLLNLLESRIYLLKDNSLSIEMFNAPLVDVEFMLKEIAANGLLAWHEVDTTDYIKSVIGDDLEMFPQDIIKPLFFSDFEALCVNAAHLTGELSIETNVIVDKIHLPIQFGEEIRHQMCSEFYNSELYCSIDICHHTDEEILVELKRLLPLFRTKFGVCGPQQTSQKRIGISTIRNIVDYKVLAFLDLKIWSMVSHCEFSNEFLARTLFPEPLENFDYVSGKNVSETRAPFVDNFIQDPEFIRKINIWSKTRLANGKIPLDMTISEILTW